MNSLPRNALAAAISAHVAGLDECGAGKLVDVIVGEIAAQLRAHSEVYVPALGTFRLKRRAARTYRTPAGVTVEAPAKTVVKVKTSEIFARRVLDAEE